MPSEIRSLSGGHFRAVGGVFQAKASTTASAAGATIQHAASAPWTNTCPNEMRYAGAAPPPSCGDSVRPEPLTSPKSSFPVIEAAPASRRLARHVVKCLRRRWASGIQPVPSVEVWANIGRVRRSVPRLHPGTVGRDMDWGVDFAVVVPHTTVGAPDGTFAIAEVVGIQHRGIHAAVRHYSSPTNSRSAVVAHGCLLAAMTSSAETTRKAPFIPA